MQKDFTATATSQMWERFSYDPLTIKMGKRIKRKYMRWQYLADFVVIKKDIFGSKNLNISLNHLISHFSATPENKVRGKSKFIEQYKPLYNP